MNKFLCCLCFTALFNEIVVLASNRSDVSFNITIPARVVLTRDENGEYSGNYKVYATTDSFDIVEISPDSNVVELTSSGKAPITAYIEQDVTTFDSSVSEATGRVYVTDNVSAGYYKGSFTFNISSIEIAESEEINTFSSEEETIIDESIVESEETKVESVSEQEIESIAESELEQEKTETDESVSESEDVNIQETESENINTSVESEAETESLDETETQNNSELDTNSSSSEEETIIDESIVESQDISIQEEETQAQEIESDVDSSLSESEIDESQEEKELESDGESI